MTLNNISFVLMSLVFGGLSALMFYLGNFLFAVVPLLSIAGMWMMTRHKNQNEETYTLESFISKYPGKISKEGYLTCPHCGHDEQRVLQTYTSTIGVHPFTRSSFDVKCAVCDEILIIEQSKKFRSTFEIAKMQRPKRHQAGSID